MPTVLDRCPLSCLRGATARPAPRRVVPAWSAPLLALLGLLAAPAVTRAAQSPIRVAEILCDGRRDPVGVDPAAVRFSWVMESEARGQSQRAYRIAVATSREALLAGRADVWDSGRIASTESLLVQYGGGTLEPARGYWWRVQVEDAEGRLAGWSAPGRFVTALASPEDWGEARWIGYEDMPERERVVPGIHGLVDPAVHPKIRRPGVPLLRRAFTVGKPVAQALLFVSGLGHYEAYLNGEKVGDRFLAPGWTDYDATVLYDAFDVTASLRPGRNAIAAIVGNGFHHVAPERYYKLAVAYGWPKLLAALRIEYTDGSRETIGTGPAWKAAPSPVTFTSIYGGEDFDARLEPSGWTAAGFDDGGWGRAAAATPPRGRLAIETDDPLRVMETHSPASVKAVGQGGFLYDFGPNASGIVRLVVRGESGRTVTLTPAELLTADGRPNQKASGEPYRWTYTLRGDGEEAWSPRFTYYGFRYVRVEGARPAGTVGPAGLPEIVALERLHTRRSAPEVGRFETSFDLFNRTFRLIRWAIRSNLASVVTDCPHREKLGWLEQTYLMGDAVHFNYDLHRLYRKQVADVLDAQTTEGLFPDIAPEYVEFEAGFRDSPEWGTAGVHLPWLLHRWYRDRETLERAFPAMCRYVDYLGTKADGHLVSHGLGDWYDLGPRFPGEAQLTPKAVTATASYYQAARLVAASAGVLGKADDAARYEALAGRIREAFNRAFFDPKAATWSTGSQTALAMPLVVGLAPDGEDARVFASLVRRIEQDGGALTAGDVGFHYVVEALSRAGRGDLLFAMNARDDVPGYGYQLKKGATALTESWAALAEVSNNHLMLGHLMRWFYAGLLGIDQAEGSTGYAALVLKPQVVDGIDWARGGYRGPRGLVASSWRKEGGRFVLEVEVPVNATAEVHLPTAKDALVRESGRPLDGRPDVVPKGRSGETVVVAVGSGRYRFEVEEKP
ncbi:MAG TPA: family 78 glycoside hydrolase catalytic domain [Vicinamibacteria bacterium]